MLLTCPQCRSGLQVPDGTTAMVRCPACKTVFSAADSPAPEPEVDEEEAREARPKRREAERDEGDGPRPKKRAREKGSKEENRDFDPVPEEEDRRLRKRRREADAELTPEERAARRAAFARAAVGVKLIWGSFGLFMLSMVFIAGYFFQLGLTRMGEASPVFITAAGVFGLLNWILAAVGLGLCLSGPRSPGHWGYGIAAAVATAVHFVFLLVLLAQDTEYCVGRGAERALGGAGFARWSMLATRLDATMFYLTAVFYPGDQGATPKEPLTLSMIAGVIEMVRTVLVLMVLSCLSRAALDNDLAHKCTRAAGVASGGPALVALVMLAFVVVVVETNAGLNMFTQILYAVVNMGVYAILMGVLLPALVAAREVGDACDEPFQSLIPQL